MARRRTPSSRTSQVPPGAPASGTASAVADRPSPRRRSGAPSASSVAPGEGAGLTAAQETAAREHAFFSKRFWVTTYITVFLIVEIALILFFTVTGGDQKRMDAYLLEASRHEERGEWTQAVETLTTFANDKDFVGAWNSPVFLRRLGVAQHNAGQHQEAAKNLAKSASLQPKTNGGTRALAGAALWKLGRKDEALEFFQAELAEGDPNSDLANYHLGMAALERDDLVRAFQYFQALKSPEAYEAELADVRKRMAELVQKPAQEGSETLPADAPTAETETNPATDAGAAAEPSDDPPTANTP